MLYTFRSYLLIFYDMATTGFSTSTDHVIEIGAAVSSTHCKMASPKFSQLVNTDHPITKEGIEMFVAATLCCVHRKSCALFIFCSK